MDVVDIPARRHWVAEIGRRSLADGGIEPVVQRHAGAARSGLGPLADGWIDAVNTPRYARVHAFCPVTTSAPHQRLRPPRASQLKDNRIPRRSSASKVDFFPLG